MRSFMISSAVACATLAGCVLAPMAAEAAVLSISPSSATVNAGETFTLDVVMEDVENLGYIEFNLDFDAAIVSPDPVTVAMGDFLTSAGGFSTFPLFDPSFDPDTIFVRVMLGGASTPAGTPRTVLSASFAALAPGVSGITLGNVLLVDTANFSNYMIGERYDRLAFEVNNGTVDVVTPAAVPEPSTIMLTLTGLGASWWKRRRALA